MKSIQVLLKEIKAEKSKSRKMYLKYKSVKNHTMMAIYKSKIEAFDFCIQRLIFILLS